MELIVYPIIDTICVSCAGVGFFSGWQYLKSVPVVVAADDSTVEDVFQSGLVLQGYNHQRYVEQSGLPAPTEAFVR